MVTIDQRPAKKVVGKTSVFLSFKYDPKLVDAVKCVGDYSYDKNTHEWEFPVSKLSELIDSITYLDDITLNTLPEEQKEVLKLTIDHKVKPFKYQEEGIEWMINHEGGLLLDAPGLGKSLTTIYAAEELKKQKGIEHCLIICGINTLKQNWKKEIEKFSTESCRVIGEKINKNGNVNYASVKERAEELCAPIDEFFIIINVESLRDSQVVDAILNSKNHYDMMVLDECHKCKSNTSEQSKGMKKVIKASKYRYGLTGTVIINSPLDAYMPLVFVGHEKATFTNFKNYYCNVVQEYGHYAIAGFKNMDILKNELGECSLRRTKDLLDLPPKVIIPEYVEMDSEQSKFYEDIRNGVVKEADRVNIKTTSLLGLITRLRQAATCPSTLTTNQNISSCKINRAVELIEEITSNGEKVVVFSTFKDPLYNLANQLDDYLICTGDQSDQEISDNIDKFQNDPEHKVILCTTQKLGTGVTLTAASYEIFIDSSWTAADDQQAQDRCYRIGTKNTVFVYRLIAKNTIDERILDILDYKTNVSDFIVDDKLRTEDEKIRYILGLGQSFTNF